MTALTIKPFAPKPVRKKTVDREGQEQAALLLDTHNQYQLSAVLAVVERAWLEGGEGHALVRFSKREDADVVFKDVVDGILRNISVGYPTRSARRT